MAKSDENIQFIKSKQIVEENLEVIRTSLIGCVDEGMPDIESSLYNQVLGLIDDASLLNSWAEMDELIDQAKMLEQDIASWLSRKGRTSYSLPWPKK